MRINLLILFLLGFKITSYSQSLQTSIDQATNFLRKAQLPAGQFQDSTNSLFNTWETILVTDALLDHNQIQDTSIQKALKWLKSFEHSNHLICHNTKCKSSYCLETTALYIKLLARVENKDSLLQTLKYLEELKEENGSWIVGNPDVTEKLFFPSVTAFILNLYDTLDYHVQDINTSISFLVDQQLADGSWGQTWEYYNTPGYALWQILPALKTSLLSQEAYEKGNIYIIATQLENGSWNYQDAKIKNQVSAELQTALMLSCLINQKDNKSIVAIEKGIQFLLSTQQKNGCWNGGFFPIPNERYKKLEYLFSTSLIYKILVAHSKTKINE